MALGNPTLVGDDSSRNVNVIATASQTLFNVGGGYKINQISVYRNGDRLIDGIDYSATDGSSVTLTSAASDGDVLEFQIFDNFRVPDVIVSKESEQTITGDLHIEGQLTVDRDILATGVVTATTFYGDGSNLTNVGNWGVYEFVARGNISNGDPVVINNDGTVSKISAGAELTEDNYVGIAEENISHAETGAVTICSGINSSQTGLTTAKKYYINPQSGDLDLSSGSPNVVAGLSISSNEIIVSCKPDTPGVFTGDEDFYLPDGWDDRLDEGFIGIYSFRYRIPLSVQYSERRSCSTSAVLAASGPTTGIYATGFVSSTPALRVTYNTPKEKKVCEAGYTAAVSAVAYGYRFNTFNCVGWSLEESSRRIFSGESPNVTMIKETVYDGLQTSSFYDLGDGEVYTPVGPAEITEVDFMYWGSFNLNTHCLPPVPNRTIEADVYI